jgi:hypothetical protein
MLLKNAPPSAPGDMRAGAGVGWCELLVRCRPLVWAFVVVVHLACFNGLWRANVDGALYLGVGESLAAGRGYTFMGEVNDHIYPGLPLLVAGCQWLFGQTILPVLIVTTACAIAALWFTERLIRLRNPAWMGLSAIIGITLSVWWLRSSVDVMTDTPFALGAIMALYGLESLRAREPAERTIARAWPSMALLVGGLALAALMRPTVWVIVVAWAMYAALRLVWPREGSIVTRHRRAGVIALVSALCVGGAVVAIAPKWTGQVLLDGEYKEEFVSRLLNLHKLITPARLHGICADLNNAFFGQTMGPSALTVALAITMLLGLLWIVRTHLLWVLPMLVMLFVAVVASSVPRYYMFLMPTLWLAWLAGSVRFASLFGKGRLAAVVLWVCVVAPVIQNIGRCWLLIAQQRAPDIAWLRTGADRETTFYADFRDGTIPRLRSIARMVQTSTREDQIVIVPDGNLVAYFSGRRVFGERQILTGKPANWPRNVRDFGADVMAFPRHLYVSDEQLNDMIRRYIIRPVNTIATDGKDYLAEFIVVVPHGDWTNYDGSAKRLRALRRAHPNTQPTTAPTTQPAAKKKKPTTQPAKKKKPTTHPTTRRASTQSTKKKKPTPIIEPTTQSATQPVTSKKKKKRKPATHPTTSPSTQPATRPTTAGRLPFDPTLFGLAAVQSAVDFA